MHHVCVIDLLVLSLYWSIRLHSCKNDFW